MDRNSLKFVAGGLAAVVVARAAAQVVQNWWNRDEDGRVEYTRNYFLTQQPILSAGSKQVAISGVGMFLAPYLKDTATGLAQKASSHWATTALATVAALTVSRGFVTPIINNIGVRLGNMVSEDLFEIYISKNIGIMKPDMRAQGAKYAVLEACGLGGLSSFNSAFIAGTLKDAYSNGIGASNVCEGLSLSMYNLTNTKFGVLSSVLGGGLGAMFAAKAAQGAAIECTTGYMSPSRHIITTKARDESGRLSLSHREYHYGNPMNILRDAKTFASKVMANFSSPDSGASL